MADSSVAITAGSGTSIDTRTEATNGQHRQVVVLGDPSVNAGVAPVDATNGLAVDVKTLPPGAATSSNQTTANTSLSSLDTKTPALGQALAAASVPVILPAATVTTLTPPAAITGFATSSNQTTANTSLSSIDGKLPALVSSRVPVDGSGVTQPVTPKPSTSGGYTIYRNLDVQSTGVNVKASAGQVYGWYIANLASSVRYVKLYNKATTPTVGTDVPVLTIAVPANGAANVEYEIGIAFATGIGIGGVTGVADNSTGAPTANDIICNLLYN